MSSFERAEEQEILDAMARAAGYDIELVEIPDTSLPPIKQTELAPNVRHINRSRHGMCWLGPAIEKPEGLR